MSRRQTRSTSRQSIADQSPSRHSPSKRSPATSLNNKNENLSVRNARQVRVSITRLEMSKG